MNFLKEKSYNEILNILGLIFIFSIFLYPSSFKIVDVGRVSINYFYILFPIFIVILRGKFVLPKSEILLIISFYVFVFFLGAIYQIELLEYLDRRVMSFMIFMSIFSFQLIKINNSMLEAFKYAIVSITIIFVIDRIMKFYAVGGDDAKFLLKGLVGSQRFGFVYLFAFWILLLNKFGSRFLNMLRYFLIFLVVVGLVLTFSRSSIISLLLSLILFILSNFVLKKKIFSLEMFFIFFKYAVISIIFLILLNLFVPYSFKFFDNNLFTYLRGENFEDLNFNSQFSSEGYRVFIWEKIFNYVSLNPITGSAYLGCWIMFEYSACSVHNQYIDVFFRTGFIGFAIYMYILIRIFNYLKFLHTDLFWAFVSIIIYGFFHETFKLSQGAFILSFLLCMTINSPISNKLKKFV
jgi:O-antigen ligase